MILRFIIITGKNYQMAIVRALIYILILFPVPGSLQLESPSLKAAARVSDNNTLLGRATVSIQFTMGKKDFADP